MERRYLLLAAVLTALVFLPVASAEAAKSGATASAKLKQANKRIKALSRQLRALEASLDQRFAALAPAGPTAPSSPSAPSSPTAPGSQVTPSGPAGGDLSGFFPNPLIAPDAVASEHLREEAVGPEALALEAVGAAALAQDGVDRDEIASGAVASAEIGDESIRSLDIAIDAVAALEIANGSVGEAELGEDSVGAQELGTVVARTGGSGVVVPSGQTRIAKVFCPPGMRLLSGGFEWLSDADGTSIISSSPSFVDDPESVWQVEGKVKQGELQNTLIAEALCLES